LAHEDIKKISTQAIVEITGSGTEIIELRELRTPSETFDSESAQVSIARAIYSLSGNSTIERNGNVVLALAQGEYDFDFAHSHGSISEDSNFDIHVNLDEETDYVILHLDKEYGYEIKEPNLIIERTIYEYLSASDDYDLIFNHVNILNRELDDDFDVLEEIEAELVIGTLVIDDDVTVTGNPEHELVLGELELDDKVIGLGEPEFDLVIGTLEIDDDVVLEDELETIGSDLELFDDVTFEDEPEFELDIGTHELELDDVAVAEGEPELDHYIGTHELELDDDFELFEEVEIQADGVFRFLDLEDLFYVHESLVFPAELPLVIDDYAVASEDITKIRGLTLELLDDVDKIDDDQDDIIDDGQHNITVIINETVPTEDEFTRFNAYVYELESEVNPDEYIRFPITITQEVDSDTVAFDIISKEPVPNMSDTYDEFIDLGRAFDITSVSTADSLTGDEFYRQNDYNPILDDVAETGELVRFPLNILHNLVSEFDSEDLISKEPVPTLLDDVDKIDDDQDDIIDDGQHNITVIINETVPTGEERVYDISFHSLETLLDPDEFIRFPQVFKLNPEDTFDTEDLISKEPVPNLADTYDEFIDLGRTFDITASPNTIVETNDEEFTYVQDMVRYLDDVEPGIDDYIRFPTVYVVDETEDMFFDDNEFKDIEPVPSDDVTTVELSPVFGIVFEPNSIIETNDEDFFRQVDFFRDTEEFLKKGDGVYFEEDYVEASGYYTSEDAFDDTVIQAITYNVWFDDEYEPEDIISNEPVQNASESILVGDNRELIPTQGLNEEFDIDDSDFVYFMDVPVVHELDDSSETEDWILFPIFYVHEINDDAITSEEYSNEPIKGFLDDVDEIDDDQDDIIDDGQHNLTVIFNETVPSGDELEPITSYVREPEDITNTDDDIKFPIFYVSEFDEDTNADEEINKDVTGQSTDDVTGEELEFDILPNKEPIEIVSPEEEQVFNFQQETTEFLKKGDGAYFDGDYVEEGYVDDNTFVENFIFGYTRGLSDATDTPTQGFEYTLSRFESGSHTLIIDDTPDLNYAETIVPLRFTLITDTVDTDDTFESIHTAFYGFDEYPEVTDTITFIRNLNLDDDITADDEHNQSITQELIEIVQETEEHEIEFSGALDDEFESKDQITPFSILSQELEDEYTVTDEQEPTLSRNLEDITETEDALELNISKGNNDVTGIDDEFERNTESNRTINEDIETEDQTSLLFLMIEESIVTIDQYDLFIWEENGLGITNESEVEDEIELVLDKGIDEGTEAEDLGTNSGIEYSLDEVVGGEDEIENVTNTFREFNEDVDTEEGIDIESGTGIEDSISTTEELIFALNKDVRDAIEHIEDEIWNGSYFIDDWVGAEEDVPGYAAIIEYLIDDYVGAVEEFDEPVLG